MVTYSIPDDSNPREYSMSVSEASSEHNRRTKHIDVRYHLIRSKLWMWTTLRRRKSPQTCWRSHSQDPKYRDNISENAWHGCLYRSRSVVEWTLCHPSVVYRRPPTSFKNEWNERSHSYSKSRNFVKNPVLKVCRSSICFSSFSVILLKATQRIKPDNECDGDDYDDTFKLCAKTLDGMPAKETPEDPLF